MVCNIVNFTFVQVILVLFVIQSSMSNLLENERLAELTYQFYRLQTKVESIEAENEKLTTAFRGLQTENAELKSDVTALKIQVSIQDQEVVLLKRQIYNLKAVHPSESVVHNNSNIDSHTFENDTDPSSRALNSPPSSCQEWYTGSPVKLPNGIYLMKNHTTNQIDAVFCQFSEGRETRMGFVDVKSFPVHFYVQRNFPFSSSGNTIPFQVERLNIGGAMNLSSGVFTVPKAGIYEFSFIGKGIGSETDTNFRHAGHAAVYLNLNDVCIGVASSVIYDAARAYLTISLHATLNLKVGDRISLSLDSEFSNKLHDDTTYNTQFSGSLLEENLLL